MAKAREVVLALYDHYIQTFDLTSVQRQADMSDALADDSWALEYITAVRLQSIAAAIDEDASGYVTVTAANRFTMARPPKWR